MSAPTTAMSAPATVASQNEFVITRVFHAPRELVWQAWTEPKHMAAWFGPETFTIPVCKMDLRPGGAWRLVMRGPDGSEYPLSGIYREIIRPERIVTSVDVSEHPDTWFDMVEPGRDSSKGKPRYDLGWTVTFEPVADGTKLSIHNHFPSHALRDAFVKIGMSEGWGGSLDKLSKLLSRMRR
jgi:uncharacterized protein YndB with AHSA1/START domain